MAALAGSALIRSAMARATWATCRLCVSRLCTISPAPVGLTTWVTPASRAKNGEAAIRSRSTRNGLCARPAPVSSTPGRRAARSACSITAATLTAAADPVERVGDPGRARGRRRPGRSGAGRGDRPARAAHACCWTRRRTRRGGTPTAAGPTSCRPSCPRGGRGPRPRPGGRAHRAPAGLGVRRAGRARRCAPTWTPGWPRPGSTVRAGRAVGRCRAGRGRPWPTAPRLRARLVVDAGGGRQPLGRPGPAGSPAEQAAYGVVVDADRGGRAAGPRRGAVHGLAARPRRAGPADVPLRGPAGRRRGAAGGDLAGPAARACRCRCCAAGCWPGWPGTASTRPAPTDERVLFRLDAPRHRGRRGARLRRGGPAGAPGQRVQPGHRAPAGPRGGPRAGRPACPTVPTRRWPRPARCSGRRPRAPCTGSAGSGWRRCCGCRRSGCRTSSRCSSGCPNGTAGPTSPAATTCAAPAATMGALFAAADWALRARLVVPGACCRRRPGTLG